MTMSLMSFKPGTSGADILKYYEEVLSAQGEREDYYMQPDQHAEMHGRGLERLAPSVTAGENGLKSYDRKIMMNLLEGKDASGKELVKGAGAGDKRVPGYDMTFSPDKSVSIAWAAASPEMRLLIQQAHDDAVRDAIDYIQDNYRLANEGHAGKERVKAGLSVAIFRHGTSRELDMQLHSHCVTAGVAVKEDGTVLAVNSRELYQRQKESSGVYRASLADRLQKLSLEIERKGDNFRIAGIPQAVCDFYSTRRKQIVESLNEKGLSGAKASEIAALDTRQTKNSTVKDAELLEKWQSEMAEMGLTAADIDNLRTAARDPDKPVLTMPTQAEFLQKLTEKNSTFGEFDVWREAAVAAQGVASEEGAKKLIENYAKDFLSTRSPDVLRLQHKENAAIRYTSREMYDLERKMIIDSRALQ